MWNIVELVINSLTSINILKWLQFFVILSFIYIWTCQSSSLPDGKRDQNPEVGGHHTHLECWSPRKRPIEMLLLHFTHITKKNKIVKRGTFHAIFFTDYLNTVSVSQCLTSSDTVVSLYFCFVNYQLILPHIIL